MSDTLDFDRLAAWMDEEGLPGKGEPLERDRHERTRRLGREAARPGVGVQGVAELDVARAEARVAAECRVADVRARSALAPDPQAEARLVPLAQPAREALLEHRARRAPA